MVPDREGRRDGEDRHRHQVLRAGVAREVDDELAVRLGRDGALVVVTGPPLAEASRTAARAARRMLGSERVVAPGAVSTVDVAELVATLDGPGVV